MRQNQAPLLKNDRKVFCCNVKEIRTCGHDSALSHTRSRMHIYLN